MEYMIWVVLAVAVVAVIWYKTRIEGNPSAEEQKEMEDIVEARGNAPISTNVTGRDPSAEIPADVVAKATFREGATRNQPKVVNTARPASPPPARPAGLSGGFAAPYGGASVSSPANNGITGMDVITGLLVVDALTPDPVPAAEPVRTPDPEPTRYEPEPVRDTTDYGSSSSTDYGSSSSTDYGSSSSSSDYSSSDSSSSSSSSFD